MLANAWRVGQLLNKAPAVTTFRPLVPDVDMASQWAVNCLAAPMTFSTMTYPGNEDIPLCSTWVLLWTAQLGFNQLTIVTDLNLRNLVPGCIAMSSAVPSRNPQFTPRYYHHTVA
ncbi:hypothetical protein CI238_05867 [Colletotrichum incanum]|uniref:Uncharacterized protein n=1 Tax=Colletotrichum incanum TaxID=1573173 RepID=A0A162P073_COLIC|nr:hypothetical protein CI238_05867 [Colletotrichum incanum]